MNWARINFILQYNKVGILPNIFDNPQLDLKQIKHIHGLRLNLI